jgi:hypothetical protein
MRQIGFGLMVAMAFLVALGMLAWGASAATGKVSGMLDSRKKKREEALTAEQKQKLVTAHNQSYHDYGAINEAHKSVETQVRASVAHTCWPSPYAAGQRWRSSRARLSAASGPSK